jgi:hypothetical protein
MQYEDQLKKANFVGFGQDIGRIGVIATNAGGPNVKFWKRTPNIGPTTTKQMISNS